MRNLCMAMILVIILPFCAGCGLSAAERKAIIREAGNAAAVQAASLAKREALNAGLSEEAAVEVGRIAAEKARELAEKGADEVTPEASEGGGKWMSVLTSLVISGLQLAAGHQSALKG